MPSLTNPQKRALRALATRGGWITPYGLWEARRTLEVLVDKGLVARRKGNAPGAIAHPNVTLEYTATDKGKEAIRELCNSHQRHRSDAAEREGAS